MKQFKPILIVVISFLIMSSFTSCASAEKAAKERRNLMMPKTSDLKKNSKFNPSKERKTYKHKKPKKR